MPMTKISSKTKPVYLQAAWPAPANVHTLISTSIAEFNLATHATDDLEQVLHNRQELRAELPATPLWLNQTHSTGAINHDQLTPELLSSEQGKPPEGDASFTRQSGKVCVVMTADCLPILLTNRSGDFVAAIHAGWRGLCDDIIAQTLTQLGEYPHDEVLAFIGPAIGAECFEVGTDVRARFVDSNPAYANFFSASQQESKYLANLRGIAALKLEELGIPAANISNPAICTRCTPEWFYSYRGNPTSGRFASLIWKD